MPTFACLISIARAFLNSTVAQRRRREEAELAPRPFQHFWPFLKHVEMEEEATTLTEPMKKNEKKI